MSYGKDTIDNVRMIMNGLSKDEQAELISFAIDAITGISVILENLDRIAIKGGEKEKINELLGGSAFRFMNILTRKAIEMGNKSEGLRMVVKGAMFGEMTVDELRQKIATMRMMRMDVGDFNSSN